MTSDFKSHALPDAAFMEDTIVIVHDGASHFWDTVLVRTPFFGAVASRLAHLKTVCESEGLLLKVTKRGD